MTQASDHRANNDVYVVLSDFVNLCGVYVLEQRWVQGGVVGRSFIVDRADAARLHQDELLQVIAWYAQAEHSAAGQGLQLSEDADSLTITQRLVVL